MRRPGGVAVLLAVALAVASASCGRSRDRDAGRPRLVRVAAASDLRFALEAFTTRWKSRRSDVTLEVTYGSSGTLYAQLVNGAPFDLFMSADIEYPRQLEARGLAVPGSSFVYGIGRLVIWVPAASAIDIERGFESLRDAGVVHVAIANPAHAPYGRAAEEALRRAGQYDLVRPKLVLGDNVAQALQFVQSGSADAGVVALSLALAPSVKATGRFWTVPVEWYARLDQGGVIMRNAVDLDAANEVRADLGSDEGRALLKNFGFALPGE